MIEAKTIQEKRAYLRKLFSFDDSQVNYLINISNKYKYIYFETPKVGCSTIKKTLQKLEVEDISKLPEDVHAKHISPLLSPLDLEDSFDHYLNNKEYFKFAFVRNPYTRVLSGYLDKIVTNQVAKKKILPSFGLKPTDELSFLEFLQILKNQSFDEMNPHWRPQHILLGAENINLDFIGKQETFDNDLKKILAIIHNENPDENQIINEIPHAVGANSKLEKYLTPITAKLIDDIYEKDFLLYGYKKIFFTEPSSFNKKIEIKTIKSNNLVSVIIPCFNQAQYLKEAVESVVAQTYRNIEVVIVNDGSIDNTLQVSQELIALYPNFNIKLVNQNNMGLSAARNSGIHAADGEYIVTLDADDKLDSKMIMAAINAIKKNNVDIVYGNYQRFEEVTSIQETRTSVDLYFIQYQNITGATALYHKRVWEKTGGYKQNMHGGYEDWELWVNAVKLGFQFYHIPQIFFYYRTKAESMYTESMNIHDYLCSKIVMNHPELYTDMEKSNAVKSIKSHEKAADIYFYIDKDMTFDERTIVTVLGMHIDKLDLYDELFTNPYYTLRSFKDYGDLILCNISYINTTEELSSIISRQKTDLIIFYSSLRYDIIDLNNISIASSLFAWKKEIGCINVNGSIFPLNKENDLETLLEAYKRSQKYYKEEYLKLDKIRTQLRNSRTKLKNRYLDDSSVNTLRDCALALEKQNIFLAHELMSIVHTARPNGPFIKKKLDQYRSMLEQKDKL